MGGQSMIVGKTSEPVARLPNHRGHAAELFLQHFVEEKQIGEGSRADEWSLTAFEFVPLVGKQHVEAGERAVAAADIAL
jgi:hypothetical protein